MKLILTDLDGTFLNSEGQFDRDYFKAVKQKLEEKQIAFAAVTGKQVERVEELFGDAIENVWILGDSASRIKYNGKFFFESLIQNAFGMEIMRELEKIQGDQTIIACTPNAAYIQKSRPEIERLGVRRSYAVVKETDDWAEIKEDFVKITVLDVQKRAFETIKGIQKYENQLYMVASEPMWIDITDFGVHKGTTVQRLQEILNVSKQETVAFGDGYNDFEMFEEAGTTYAMANAFDDVKKKAFLVLKL
jgi:Cof subfamily protein (haloacid dehalogenase superfamily)